MSNPPNKLNRLAASAICLALAMVLPLVTANIQQIGNMLCPMHFPVIICGFICGWKWGAAVGFIAPLLRFMIFGMPPVMPNGIGMAFELAAYAIVVALLYERLPKKKSSLYISLITAMIAGRIVWGIARVLLTGVTGKPFTFAAFIAGSLSNSIPGIILQIILIPVIVMALKRQ